ncbi:hypothetical protein ACFL4A_03640 [bacterium]
MYKKIKMKKFIGLCISIIILIESICTGSVPIVSVQPIANISQDLTIAQGIGKVVENYAGDTNKPKIFVILDLHCHTEAQENIEKIICMIKRKEKNKKILVGIEGDTGYIDTSLVANISDKKLKETIFKELFDKGLITGAEAYDIKHRNQAILYGIEDVAVYEQNVRELYKGLQNNGWHEEIASLRAEIKQRKKIYNRRLIMIEKEQEKYEKGYMNIARYIRNISCKTKIIPDRNKYKNIRLYLKAEEIMRKIKINAVNTEALNVSRRISGNLTKKEIKALEESKKKNGYEYYEILKNIVRARNILLGKSYQNLEAYFRWLETKEKIDELMLNEEIGEYVYSIKELSASSDEMKETIFMSRYIELAEAYITNSASVRMCEEFESKEKEFYGLLEKNRIRLSKTKEKIMEMKRFYDTAMKRNEIMVTNLLELPHPPSLPKRGSRKVLPHYSIMLVGGFHRDGITKQLRTQGIGYSVIVPNVTKGIDKAQRIYKDRLEKTMRILEAKTENKENKTVRKQKLDRLKNPSICGHLGRAICDAENVYDFVLTNLLDASLKGEITKTKLKNELINLYEEKMQLKIKVNWKKTKEKQIKMPRIRKRGLISWFLNLFGIKKVWGKHRDKIREANQEITKWYTENITGFVPYDSYIGWMNTEVLPYNDKKISLYQIKAKKQKYENLKESLLEEENLEYTPVMWQKICKAVHKFRGQPARIDTLIERQSGDDFSELGELLSNAIDAQTGKPIGRFGKGFQQVLARVLEGGSVIVRTKAANNDSGTQIEFRNIYGKIYVRCRKHEEAIDYHGTEVEVVLKDGMDEKTCAKMIKYLKKFECITKLPIIFQDKETNIINPVIGVLDINGKEIGYEEKAQNVRIVTTNKGYKVIDNGIGMLDEVVLEHLLLPEHSTKKQLEGGEHIEYIPKDDEKGETKCTITLLIGGVLIREKKVTALNMPQEIRLHLPLNTKLPASRNEIIVDEIVIQGLHRLVSSILEIKHADRYELINGLAAGLDFIESMSDSNEMPDESAKTIHELICDMKKSIKDALMNERIDEKEILFLPNRQAFRALAIHAVNQRYIYVDPSIAQMENMEKAGIIEEVTRVMVTDETQWKQTGTHRLYIGDFIDAKEDIRKIELKDEGAIIVDRAVFEYYRNKNLLKLLELWINYWIGYGPKPEKKIVFEEIVTKKEEKQQEEKSNEEKQEETTEREKRKKEFCAKLGIDKARQCKITTLEQVVYAKNAYLLHKGHAYYAGKDYDGTWALYDGKTKIKGGFDMPIYDNDISVKNGQVFFKACKDRDWAVYNGKERVSESFEEITEFRITEEGLVYVVACEFDRSTATYFQSIYSGKQKVSEDFDNISDIQTTKDGRIYYRSSNQTKDGRVYALYDRKEKISKTFRLITNVKYTEDGHIYHVGYWYPSGYKFGNNLDVCMQAWFDGKEKLSDDFRNIILLQTTKDHHVYYLGHKDTKEGKSCALYDRKVKVSRDFCAIGNPKIREDDHIYYIGFMKTKDGIKYALYDKEAKVSPDFNYIGEENIENLSKDKKLHITITESGHVYYLGCKDTKEGKSCALYDGNKKISDDFSGISDFLITQEGHVYYIAYSNTEQSSTGALYKGKDKLSNDFTNIYKGGIYITYVSITEEGDVYYIGANTYPNSGTRSLYKGKKKLQDNLPSEAGLEISDEGEPRLTTVVVNIRNFNEQQQVKGLYVSQENDRRAFIKRRTVLDDVSPHGLQMNEKEIETAKEHIKHLKQKGSEYKNMRNRYIITIGKYGTMGLGDVFGLKITQTGISVLGETFYVWKEKGIVQEDFLKNIDKEMEAGYTFLHTFWEFFKEMEGAIDSKEIFTRFAERWMMFCKYDKETADSFLEQLKKANLASFFTEDVDRHKVPVHILPYIKFFRDEKLNLLEEKSDFGKRGELLFEIKNLPLGQVILCARQHDVHKRTGYLEKSLSKCQCFPFGCKERNIGMPKDFVLKDFAQLIDEIEDVHTDHITKEVISTIDGQSGNELLPIRELYQNSRAAMRKGKISGDIEISHYIREHQEEEKTIEVVLSMHDNVGMTLWEVINLLLTPKQGDKEKAEMGFGGEFGIGFYTVFNHADAVEVRTGKENGLSHELRLSIIRDAQRNITDIRVEYIKEYTDKYQGTDIRMITEYSQNEIIKAQIKSLGKIAGIEKVIGGASASYVQYKNDEPKQMDEKAKENIVTKYNGEKIETKRELLGEVRVEPYGLLRIARDIDSYDKIKIEQDGLYVTDREELLALVPAVIRRMISDKGLVIELPKRLPLVSSRNDIAYKEKNLEKIQKAVAGAMIYSAIYLYTHRGARIPALPADFGFSAAGQDVEQEIQKDAEYINRKQWDKVDFRKYQDEAKAVKLLTRIVRPEEQKSLKSIAEEKTEAKERRRQQRENKREEVSGNDFHMLQEICQWIKHKTGIGFSKIRFFRETKNTAGAFHGKPIYNESTGKIAWELWINEQNAQMWEMAFSGENRNEKIDALYSLLETYSHEFTHTREIERGLNQCLRIIEKIATNEETKNKCKTLLVQYFVSLFYDMGRSAVWYGNKNILDDFYKKLSQLNNDGTESAIRTIVGHGDFGINCDWTHQSDAESDKSFNKEMGKIICKLIECLKLGSFSQEVEIIKRKVFLERKMRQLMSVNLFESIWNIARSVFDGLCPNYIAESISKRRRIDAHESYCPDLVEGFFHAV